MMIAKEIAIFLRIKALGILEVALHHWLKYFLYRKILLPKVVAWHVTSYF
jgi:hypothetical protein